MSRDQSAKQRATERELLWQHRPERQEQRDVPNELVGRDARERGVAHRLAEDRGRES